MKASLPPQAAPRSTPETRARNTGTKPYRMPFTVIVDTREGAPFLFDHLEGASKFDYRPFIVPVERSCLKTGDYSVKGFSVPSQFNNFKAVVIERKSIDDLFGSLGRYDNRRDRFRAEHERMMEIMLHGGRAMVVIEAEYRSVEARKGKPGPPPEDILNSQVRWFERYNVPWFFMGGRDESEQFIFRTLRNFYELHKHELQPEALKESNT